MATEILNNCHFDSTKIQKLYLGAPTFPLEYKTIAGSVDSIITYDLWTGDTILIGGQYIILQEVLSTNGNIVFDEELVIDTRGKNYVKTISFNLSGINLSLIDSLELYTLTINGKITPTKLIGILIDENNETLICGYDNPLTLESSAAVIGEDNLITFIFKSSSKSRSRIIEK